MVTGVQTCALPISAILLTILDPYLPKPFEEDEFDGTDSPDGTQNTSDDKIVPPDDDMKWLL